MALFRFKGSALGTFAAVGASGAYRYVSGMAAVAAAVVFAVAYLTGNAFDFFAVFTVIKHFGYSFYLF